jgi:hypothetical protein
MARTGWVLLLALACSAAGGCPGDDDETAIAIGGPGSTADPCDEWKAWKLRCTPDASAEDLDYYDECRMLHWNKVEPAFTRAMAECFPTLSCGQSDDACSAKGFEAIGVTAQSVDQDALVQECRGAIQGCGFGDDLCVQLTALTDPARSDIKNCPKNACDAYDACARDVVGAGKRRAH